MYFQDSAPYTYLNCESHPNLLTVGWLDAEHDFPKGKVSEDILEKILALCFKPVNATRGIHFSPFLPRNPYGYAVEYKGKKMGLGSAEIRVPGREGKCYVAPNLIYHYIKDCGYLPPKEFFRRSRVYGYSNMWHSMNAMLTRTMMPDDNKDACLSPDWKLLLGNKTLSPKRYRKRGRVENTHPLILIIPRPALCR
jgi:hypothetical protein